ncbi:MAG: general secretion pathway protein GspK, partial [Bdellovibrionaceae bacterium]|nr:general secretion pathway protein GspK [Pseudobdellovibrionaceae bacterium]
MILFKTIQKRLKYNPLRKTRKNGIAMLMAMTSLILMVYLASEVTKDSAIEYVVNSQEINRIKAYYAARNSMEVALLRIKIYQQVSAMQLPPGFAQEIDNLWKFPFGWPLPITGSMSSSDKDSSEKKSKAALFDGQYDHIISDEGSKIDINDLASPSEVLRTTTSKQILNIFQQQLDSHDEFRDQYQNFNFVELVNRITDWISDTQDNQSKNGGDKRAAFQSLGEDYPPNRGFRTLDELRLIPGMTDEFYTLLAPQITIYGSKAINPNLAPSKVLKSLDKGINDESIKEALERRDDPDKGGPFKGTTSDECRNDFKNFITGLGSQLDPEFDKIPFSCDKVLNFRIQATGRSGSGKGAVQKKLTAIVIDINKIASQVKSYVDKEKKDAQQQQQQASGQPPPVPPKSGPTSGTQTKEPLPKGRPRIVYWSE